MSNNKKEVQDSALSRRVFIKASTAVASAGLLTACGVSNGTRPMEMAAGTKPVMPLTKEARDAMTPDQIIQRAKDGNHRFRTGQQKHRDLLMEMQSTANGQNPAAVLLSCIDSRAPAEIIFDLGLGDIFNCRVAGNIENLDILGSMEFATKLSGAKVVLVLGHSACGAVKGAIADAQLGNLTQLLEKFRPAIEATSYIGDRSANNYDFVDAVARTSILLTKANIRQKSPVIAELERANQVKVIGGFYNLSTGIVDFI